MYLAARLHRSLRPAAVLSGAVSLVLALGAATSADVAAAMPVAAGARAADSGGTWGTAQETAGALNTGGNAELNSVSCTSAGNCSAVGYYNSKPGHQGTHAFAVNEVNGTWGTAQEVRDLAGDFDFYLNAVSCGSPGNCSAGGLYFAAHTSHNYAFVVDEVNGTWGAAQPVPGLAALDTGGGSIFSVSCVSAGNCSAGGIYRDKHDHGQSFVVDEVNGTWRKAEEIPGLGGLNVGGRAELQSLSCASAGNCSAGGFYLDKFLHGEAFVANEVNGTWGPAQEVPGTAALNKGGFAVVVGLSCASAGNCSAGGGYTTESGHGEAFVVDEVKGAWHTVQKVPPVPDTGGDDSVVSVSCASAGNCSASGEGDTHAFVLDEVSGTWRTGQEIPGTVALNTVSCVSAGTCIAGGFSAVKVVHSQAVVVSEVHGTWGTVQKVAATLNTGLSASVLSVSCAPAGTCSAGGWYEDKAKNVEAFVATGKPAA